MVVQYVLKDAKPILSKRVSDCACGGSRLRVSIAVLVLSLPLISARVAVVIFAASAALVRLSVSLTIFLLSRHRVLSVKSWKASSAYTRPASSVSAT